MNNLSLSNFVKKCRKDHHMSQTELALMSGISLATIRAIEQGTSSPNVGTLNKILNLFEYEISIKRKGE